jgi:hypothetical protein
MRRGADARAADGDRLDHHRKRIPVWDGSGNRVNGRGMTH